MARRFKALPLPHGKGEVAHAFDESDEDLVVRGIEVHDRVLCTGVKTGGRKFGSFVTPGLPSLRRDAVLVEKDASKLKRGMAGLVAIERGRREGSGAAAHEATADFPDVQMAAGGFPCVGQSAHADRDGRWLSGNEFLEGAFVVEGNVRGHGGCEDARRSNLFRDSAEGGLGRRRSLVGRPGLRGVRDALLEKMAGEITLSTDAGATLRKWRETFGLHQSELAGLLDVSASVVSDYESGRRKSPGISTVKRIVEALVAWDEAHGGPVLARYHSLLDPTEGILSIGEYRRSVSAKEFMDRIEGRAMATAGLEDKQLQGYTLIDSVKAIANLNANDYVRVFGWSTQRALVFTGIKYGRSPMIAIRVHPMKPSMVVYHKPEDVDKLAFRLADAERIPLVVTELEMAELEARLRGMA